MVDLKPCPFCGSKDVDGEGWESGSGKRGPACDDCGATAESVAEWNRRTPSPASTAGGERQSIADDAKFQDLLSTFGYNWMEGDEIQAESRATLVAHIDTWAARSAGAPVLWFKRLTGAECKPDGRCYDVVFSPTPGYEPLYSGASSAGGAMPLLREARAALETWKDVAPAVSLCADIDRFFAAPAPDNTEKPAHDEIKVSNENGSGEKYEE